MDFFPPHRAEGVFIQALDFWRGTIQGYAWFTMIFAGLHTLEEMRHDYWNPLFGSVTSVAVSFLGVEAARRLIIEPEPDFGLDYDQDAIAEIIALTHGQPYLLQLVCHNLVSRFNRRNFESGKEGERRFHLADVHAVIDEANFFHDGNAYFTGVWSQADAEQQRVQQVLAPQERMSKDELAAQSGLDAETFACAWHDLRAHDVVTEENDEARFTVELMRRWVEKTV